MVPFLEPNLPFAFQHSMVLSVSLDAHKTGGMLYSAGTFLCRKGLLEYTSTDAPYIYGHMDHTVGGSRSGAIAAACWATLMHLGRSGYEKIAKEGMAVRTYLAEKFREVPGAIVYPSRMNLLAVYLPKELDVELLWNYCIVPDTFPDPLSSRSRDDGGMLIKRVRGVYRFTMMLHVTKGKIDQFFEDLKR